MSSSEASEVERNMYIKNVEDSLKRIVSHKGVVGYYVTDPASGRLLKYAGFGESSKEARRYVDALKGFISLAQSTVRTIDWSDEMSFLRLSYGAFDIMVAPDLEKKYTLVVVQHVE